MKNKTQQLKQEAVEEFIEKGANLEHDRWVRWQKWCHRILRENCPSPELEKVLERWNRQIATPYSELSEQEKESDRKETRNYVPLLKSYQSELEKAVREEIIENFEGIKAMDREMLSIDEIIKILTLT